MKKILLTTLVLWSGIILVWCWTKSTENQLTVENDSSVKNMDSKWGRWMRWWMMWSGNVMWSWNRMGSGNMVQLSDEERELMQEIMEAKQSGDTTKESEAKTKLKALKPEMFSGDELKMPAGRWRMGSWDRQWMMWSGDMPPMQWSWDAQPMPLTEPEEE